MREIPKSLEIPLILLMAMVRTWCFLTHGHAVWEVGGLNLGRDTIGGVFRPARQLARFSPSNMPSVVNYKIYLELVTVVEQ